MAMALLFMMLGSLLAETVELPPYLDPRLSRHLFEEEFPTLLQSRTLKLKNPVNVFVHDDWLYAAGERITKFWKLITLKGSVLYSRLKPRRHSLRSFKCTHQYAGFMSNQVLFPCDNFLEVDAIKTVWPRMTACQTVAPHTAHC